MKTCIDCNTLILLNNDKTAALSGRCDGCQEDFENYLDEKANHGRQYYNDGENQD